MGQVREFERDPLSRQNVRCFGARDKIEYWPVKYNQYYMKASTEFARFENLNTDTADKTKICHDKICPSILSGQFQFCPQVWIGPLAS